MKAAAIAVLLISVAANAAMFVLWQRGTVFDRAGMRANGSVRMERNVGANATVKGSAISLQPWAAIQSDDLATLTANLRAAGFPPAIVRAVVSRRVSAFFADRRREATGPDKMIPFWDVKRSRTISERNAKLSEVRQDEQRMLRDLLGADAMDEDTRDYQRRRLSFLPAEKIDQIAKIEADYDELRSSTMRGMARSAVFQEDREKLTIIEKEKQADLAAVLTPAEVELYNLYYSPTAQIMRFRLGNFAPTEEEFREIFELRRVVDERYEPVPGISDPAVANERAAAEKDLEAQVKGVLGDERYAAYQRSNDPGYAAASNIVEHFKLPAENAVEVFNLQKSAQDAQKTIAANSSQDPEQTRRELAALATQMNERLSSLLTADGSAAYRQAPGGSWLRTLEIRSAPRTPRPPGG